MVHLLTPPAPPHLGLGRQLLRPAGGHDAQGRALGAGAQQEHLLDAVGAQAGRMRVRRGVTVVRRKAGRGRGRGVQDGAQYIRHGGADGGIAGRICSSPALCTWAPSAAKSSAKSPALLLLAAYCMLLSSSCSSRPRSPDAVVGLQRLAVDDALVYLDHGALLLCAARRNVRV